MTETIAGLSPVSASAIALLNPQRTKEGKPDAVPREATEEDLQRIREDYRASALRAKRAGFDGIEMHCAYGFLLDSFLRDGINKRTDKYGGPV